MATYKELMAQKAKLEAQIDAARAQELEAVTLQVRQIIAEYGLTAEELGLAVKKKAKRGVTPPKYQDPKTGVTWTGAGVDCRQEL